MELVFLYLSRYPSHFAAYIALQRAFMRCYVSRGGSVEDFCVRLAPVYRRRFEPLFFGPEAATRAAAGPAGGTSGPPA